MQKKTVLFFGDSLTFCYDAKINDRMVYENRWTTIVENKFSDKYRFIIEGQGGRTIDNDDGIEGRNGVKAFTQVLYSHYYVDVIFIMLGTNELKDKFRTDAKTIAKKFEKIKSVVDEWKVKPRLFEPKITLVAPPKIYENFIPEGWGIVGAQEVSNELANEYEQVAKKLGWDFLDASEVKVSEVDGVHLDEKGNRELADLVSNYLENLA